MNRLRRLLLAIAFTPLLPALSGPADLDPSFGDAGRVLEPIGPAYDSASAILVQPDGKIVTAGTSEDQGISYFGLLRLLPDGSVDTGFGSAGKVLTGLGSGQDSPRAIAIQSDGKLIVVGQREFNGAYSFGIVRYNSDGSLDTGFASGGKLIFDPGTGGGSATGVAVQPDQKILVAGEGYGAGQSFAIVRLNPDGSLDSSFGTGGVVLDQVTAGATFLRRILLQPDGAIVAAGYAGTGGPNEVTVVARYLATGARDITFGTGGVASLAIAGKNALAQDIARQPDGKLVVTGQASTNNDARVLLARFNSDGTLDAGFGTGGIVQNAVSSTYAYALAVRLQADGKILVTGSTQEKNNYAVVLLRYGADGVLDPGFGAGGVVVTRAGLVDTGAECMAVQSDGMILLGGDAKAGPEFDALVLRFQGGEPLPPLDAPVVDTRTVRMDGAAFLGFNAPAVDGGVVGGSAVVNTSTGRHTLIYGGVNADALAQTGGPDPEGATFVTLGDPVFAGEAIGFSGVALQTPNMIPSARRAPGLGTERLFAVKPGGRLAALYSQLRRTAAPKRLAAQADAAPGVVDGQFATFSSFGLPRGRMGMLYAALLHRGGTVTPSNDFGIWRERSDGSGTDLLLRTGSRFSRARGGSAGDRGLTKVIFMPPVTNSTDQRRSIAPDGGLAAMAKFDDGTSGVVRVAADGSVDVAVDTAAAVPDETGTADGNIVFDAFTPPATASGGKLALLAALKAAQRGLPPPPKQAIFSNLSGNMARVLAQGDRVPGRRGLTFGQLGQPALGQRGMIGLMASLTGRGVKPATKTAIVRVNNGVRTVVARLGDPVPGMPDGVVYRKFMSMVVTDSDPARLVYTATIGGSGVNGSSNVGLWSVSATAGTNLLLRKGSTIMVGGQPLAVRTFDALQAPKNNVGQGRSTDESGFVTAKAKLSDGRVGVLRIPLP